MVIQVLGGGALKLESENNLFFWTRDDARERTQNLNTREEAVNALRTRGGLRWAKTKKELPK